MLKIMQQAIFVMVKNKAALQEGGGDEDEGIQEHGTPGSGNGGGKPRESPGSGNIDLVGLIEQPEWKSILIDLVKSERMDPWAIDITELSDKYLAKINSLQSTDLRIPANAILCSAILLKFKARVLRISSIEEEEEAAATPEEKEVFEAMLPELRTGRKGKEGRVSLDFLVESIERMLERGRGRKQKIEVSEKPEFLIPMLEESIEEKMGEIYEQIRELADNEGMVLFSQLVKGKTRPMEIVLAFLSLLFLANREMISIWQNEFFGEIFISLQKEAEASQTKEWPAAAGRKGRTEKRKK